MIKVNNYSVAIIILNWNGLHHTVHCVNSLIQDINRECRIIVVDNGSSNNEAEVLKKVFKNKVYVLEEKNNKGFTGGVNEGINFALKFKSDYYLLLNNDTEVTSGFIEALIETSLLDENNGIVGPQIFDFHNRTKNIFAGGKINWLLARPYHETNLMKLKENQFITGCSMLIKREVVEKIGSLDSDFFAYFEDAAYCLRARKAGFKCVLSPNSKIYHIEAASSGGTSPLKTYLMSRNRIIFAKKYGPPILQFYFVLFFLFKLIFVTIYFLTKKDIQRLYAYYYGYADGIRGLGGTPHYVA